MDKYKLSLFNVVKRTVDGFLVFNTLTQGLMLLDESHYTMLNSLKINNEALEKFLHYGFIVPETKNEIEFLKFHNLQTKFDSSRMNLTIATTNTCNFRCPYCYQPHKAEYLSTDIETAIIDFIKAKINAGVKILSIHWFGGEPLLNFPLILSMEQQLKKLKTINYTSSITTNGYLITDEIVQSLKKTNIRFFQITIDGDEPIHNKTRILKNGAGTFSTVMNNIKLLLSENIPVLIRYNINKFNENVVPFLNYLISENLNTRIPIHFSETKKFDICYTNENIFYNSTEEYSRSLLKVYNDLLENGFPIPQYSANFISCEFDCLNSFLINTDGKLYQCSACDHESKFYMGELLPSGNIEYSNNNYMRKMLRDPFDNLDCVHCKVLPICMGGCNFLELKNKNKCIPEKYIIADLAELYYRNAMRGQA